MTYNRKAAGDHWPSTHRSTTRLEAVPGHRLRRPIPLLAVCGLLLLVILSLAAPPVLGIYGTTDVRLAGSLVAPFFEVGIDEATEPHDTLISVRSHECCSLITLHWEVRTVNGARAFYGHETLAARTTWISSLRDLISREASAQERQGLVDGAYYRGFMTIDVVTAPTALSPVDLGYPFAGFDSLLGHVYYVRLAQGSANGMPMIHLESISTFGNAPLYPVLGGFYGQGARESIDIEARNCAKWLTTSSTFLAGQICSNTDARSVQTLENRVYRAPALSGRTRIIIFAWNTTIPDGGGPSFVCAFSGQCSPSFPYVRAPESGPALETGNLNLDRVVNIIEPGGPIQSGYHAIEGVTSPAGDLQLYTFAFHSASPAGNPNINWDAIFEGYID